MGRLGEEFGLRMLDERECLQGLAQAHVVGEDPAQPAPVEQRQPPESLHLIRAQCRAVQVGHLDGGQMFEVGQGADRVPPGHGGFRLVGEVFEIRPQAHMHAGDLRRSGFPFGDEVRLGEESLELVEDRLVQR